MPGAAERHTLEVAREDAGQRLDLFLKARLPEISRARLQALIREGHLFDGSAVVNALDRRVKPGERFELAIPEALPTLLEGEAMPLAIVFEDDHLLVLDKPAGLVVHPAAGHAAGTLVNALLAHCGSSLSGIGGVARPGIVHRIDKDVSGLLVVAKHDQAHVRLASQFSVHSVERAYEAIVWGRPHPARGSIDWPIGRHPVDRKRMAVVERGKRAGTDYEVLDPSGQAAGAIRASHLRCTLRTGRTHQIRVHLSALGHPILGDRLYKPRRRPQMGQALREMLERFARIALHATALGFAHPTSGEHLRFTSPPPADFALLLELAGMP